MFSINVSTGGACAEIMRVLPVGTDLDGIIYLDGLGSNFAARVAWAAPGDFRLNQLGQMGMRFLRIDPAFERALAVRDARSKVAAAPDMETGAKSPKRFI